MTQASSQLALFSALKRHWWVPFVAFPSVLGASMAYLAATPPLYETSARLIVGEKDISVSELGQALNEIDTTVPGKVADPVATQAELVTSQKVLRRAVESFHRDAKIPTEELPTPQELSRSLEVEIVPATNILELTYEHPDPKVAAGLLNAIAKAGVAENIETIRLEASTFRKFLEEKIPKQQEKLQIAAIAESQYRRNNGLVSLEDQTKSLVEGLADLETEERTLLAQLQETATKDNLLQQVTGVNNAASAYTAVRVGQDETLKDLQNKLTEIEVAVVEGRSRLGDRHPEFLALLQRREELRSLFAQRLEIVAAEPENTDARETASNPFSQDLISRYVVGQIERKALEDKLKLVQAELNELRSRVTLLPVQQQPLAALVRQREEAEASLKLLQGKLEEARIAEAQLISSTRIIGLAEVPEEAVSPKPLVVLVIGTAAGMILAIGIVVLLELLDVTLRDAAEVEAAMKLPVLGELPKLPAAIVKSPGLEQFLNDPARVEPYRALLKTLESRDRKSSPNNGTALNNGAHPSQIRESPTGQKAHLIVVSSALVGEGKSAVALYLSAVAAMLSRRTLLIDADLRRPVQDRLLGLPAYPGLTEVVENPSALLEMARSTEVENLSALLHGQLISRPSTLIEAASMKVLLEKAAADYDWIVIEASPTSVCADAATLSQWTDGLVLVVRPNFTPKPMLLQAVSELQKSGASILGAVLNETVMPVEKRGRVFPSGVGAQKSRQTPVSSPVFPTGDVDNR